MSPRAEVRLPAARERAPATARRHRRRLCGKRRESHRVRWFPMSEARAIARGGPFSRQAIRAALDELGVVAGCTLLVHSSLSQLGFVIGGAQAVVLALMDVVGDAGTLVMPAQSGDWSDRSQWANPPVPAAWHEHIREHMPAYDPRLTPTRGVGAVVDCFRHVPGVLRSGHPSVSFAARGPNVHTIVDGHELANGLEGAHRWPACTTTPPCCSSAWVTHATPPCTWPNVGDLVGTEGGHRRFRRARRRLRGHGNQRTGSVGAAACHLLRQRPLVDFAAQWFGRHRPCGP